MDSVFQSLWPTEEILPEAARSLAALRYAQSEEARRLAPFEATLGEIDCLEDLIVNHGFKLEDLCPLHSQPIRNRQ